MSVVVAVAVVVRLVLLAAVSLGPDAGPPFVAGAAELRALGAAERIARVSGLVWRHQQSIARAASGRILGASCRALQLRRRTAVAWPQSVAG